MALCTYVRLVIGSEVSLHVNRLIEFRRKSLETGFEEAQRSFDIEIPWLVDGFISGVSLELSGSESS